MTELANIDAYGELIESATLRIERLLPGPIERVWAYLTESELRRKWLAAGDMKAAGTPFELIWRNDDLGKAAGERPPGFPDEMRMESRIVEYDPPRKLVFTWRNSGDVSIELEPRGHKVLLTLVHRRLPDRATLIMVAAGWHTHLDVLLAHAEGREPGRFWDEWNRLKQDYDRRLPA